MNYCTKVVSKITRLSVRQIDYWDRTHFIKPSVSDASGRGSIRLYSFNDLIQLKVAKTLMDKGISLQKIRKAINYLKKNIPEIEKPLSELRFLTDGETIFTLTKNNKEIIDVLKNGQLVFLIALGEIIEDLKGEVITLQREKKYEITVKGKKYSVILNPNPEGGYWVRCPSLLGCASQGETVEEAIAMIHNAIKENLEELQDRKLKKIAKV